MAPFLKESGLFRLSVLAPLLKTVSWSNTRKAQPETISTFALFSPDVVEPK